MKNLILFVLSLFLALITKSQCRINYNNYDLIFEENFNTITNINQLKNVWQFVHDDPGWGWGDYVDTATNIRNCGEFYSQCQVSIQPGGILRLTATKLKGKILVWSDWLSHFRIPKYKSGMIQLRKDLWSDIRFDRTVGGCEDVTGFLYGMFEIRVKLPPNAECFPAFWLIGKGPTEIDIFEYGHDNRKISNNVIWWSGGTGTGCQAIFEKSTGNSLETDWHTISCVWTPTKVTFFFDERETRTINSSQMTTHPNCPLSIIVNLAMNPWHNVDSNYMDIDYIKVYKPKFGNYNLSYKNSAESIGHNVFENATGNYVNVNSAPNSIAPNINNPNEVFYRGIDNYIYVANKIGSVWNIKKLLFNDGSPILAVGDVRYLPQHDLVLYVGSNNRINLFGRSTSTSTGFYHWYLTSNWNCYWCISNDLISPTVGTLQTTPNGEVFYRGIDNKMHRYYYESGNWNHQILSSTYNPTHPVDFVKGDIVVDPNINSVFYKGSDNRLQIFYKNSFGIYEHAWIDDNWGTNAYSINDKMGSMVWAPALNGVLYNGIDNKLHLYYWNSSWNHQIIPYTYNNPSLGYAGADYLNGSITWFNSNKSLYYVGYDGRMQAFVKDNANGNWTHYWIDDFWNTDIFSSYNSSQVGKFSSTVSASDGTLYYSNRNGSLAYFKYESCENLNPPCNNNNNPKILLRGSLETVNNVNTSKNISCNIYPNPAQSIIKVSILNYYEQFTVEIYNTMGVKLISKDVFSNEDIDIKNLPNGIYLIYTKSELFEFKEKLIIY